MIRRHFDPFCSRVVEVSERVLLTKKNGLFRSGFRIREGGFGVDNEGTIDRRPQPMSMCMPEVRPALVCHRELICVRFPAAQRTLSYVRGSVRPVWQHLLNSMPACTLTKYSCYWGPMEWIRTVKVSKATFATSRNLIASTFSTSKRRLHESVKDSEGSTSHHSKKWFSSTDP
jgi:hypothetical protein